MRTLFHLVWVLEDGTKERTSLKMLDRGELIRAAQKLLEQDYALDSVVKGIEILEEQLHDPV